jgi:hypothetical protein
MIYLKQEVADTSKWRTTAIKDRLYLVRDADSFDPLFVTFLKRMGGKVTVGEFQFQLGERA